MSRKYMLNYINYNLFSNIFIFLNEINNEDIVEEMNKYIMFLKNEYENNKIQNKNTLKFIDELIKIITIKDVYRNKDLYIYFWLLMNCDDIYVLKNLNSDFESIVVSNYKGNYEKCINL
jgi:hypothetical protein